MADHQHSHHAHGHHDHSHDETSLTERNRAHWDKHASTYNSEKTQKEFGDLINKVNDLILSNINWLSLKFLNPASTSPSERQCRLLDYACGPGTITNALAGYASEYVGIDLSEKMVEQYNMRFTGQTEGPKLNAHAYSGNFFASKGPPDLFSDPKFSDFDLVAVGLGFHHFENLPLCMERLVERVKPGGTFMIIDFLTHAPDDLGGDFKDALHTVAHHGFSPEIINELFGNAGLTDVEMRMMKEEVILKKGMTPRKGFMARGIKRMPGDQQSSIRIKPHQFVFQSSSEQKA